MLKSTSNRYMKKLGKNIGPGGLGCPCCALSDTKLEKQLSHRRLRRIEKVKLKMESDNA